MNAEGYDVVVVGAGAAGCVAAERLSADPACRVLVVEAGMGGELPGSLRSLNFLPAAQDPAYQWPGLAAGRMAGQPRRPFVQGYGVGGTTLINGMIMMRPDPEDFDAWAPGWSHADLLPAMVAIERDLDFGDRPGHGASGPMTILRPPRETWGDLDAALAAWGEDRGLPHAEDHNAPHRTTGISPYAYTADRGLRHTAADGFLEPARRRANLHLLASTTVDTVVVRGGRVTGVRLRSESGVRFVAADAVVLAAGAVHSPALLLRSGIGPADGLRALGIPVVRDLPGVGGRLQDHPKVMVLFGYRRRRPVPVRPINACVRLDDGEPNQFILNALDAVAPEREGSVFGVYLVTLLRPASTGQVQITSPDPRVPPQVDLGLLSCPSDAATLRRGVGLLRDLLDHPGIRELGAPVGGPLPAAGAGASELDRWLSRQCTEAWHLVGSCRLGPEDDPSAVVDPSCRVRGVDGLMIVDASVIPQVPRANTALVTMAVAHHALRPQALPLVGRSPASTRPGEVSS